MTFATCSAGAAVPFALKWTPSPEYHSAFSTTSANRSSVGSRLHVSATVTGSNRVAFRVPEPGGRARSRLSAPASGFYNHDTRRGGRVVECVGLENRYARKGIEGSNPSLSAR